MQRKILILFFALLLAAILLFYPVLNEIGAGIAIMLLAILNLEQGFKILTEGPLRKFLRRSTDNLFKSIGVGFISTALLNSSSMVSVLVLSFLSAGLITMKAGIAVMFGSNIGTTFTAWLIALFGLNFKISTLALPLVIFGVFFIFQRYNSLKGIGYAILGLGFLFLGIHYLKTGFEGLDYTLSFLGAEKLDLWSMLGMTGAGIIATVLLQSSAASLAIILTALVSQQISYPEGLVLMVGINIGTTFTALIGSVASDPQGKKLALSHLMFNVITAIFSLIFLRHLQVFVDFLSAPLGIGSGEFALKLALFHTIFNFFGLIIMTPWLDYLIKFLDRIITKKEEEVIKAKFLNKSILDHPQSTIHALLKETEHLLDHTFEIIAHGLNVHREDLLKDGKVSRLLAKSRERIPINIDEEYIRKVKHIYSKIIKYASLAQEQNLTAEEQESISNIKYATRLIVEVIKDLEEFRKNLNEFLSSDNEYLRDTYDKYRKRLVKIIKELLLNLVHYPYQSDYSKTPVKQLDDSERKKIKENLKHQRNKINQLAEDINQITTNMIAERKIKSRMASSIINDSVYVTRIGNNLLTILEILYSELNEFDFEDDELNVVR